MARQAAKNAIVTFNAVSLVNELDTADLKITNTVPEVTAFGDGADTFVEGKYGSQSAVSGAWDPAANKGDATIYGQIGAGAAAFAFTPAGGATGPTNPQYQASSFVKDYTISSQVKQAVKYNATFQHSGALTRATS